MAIVRYPNSRRCLRMHCLSWQIVGRGEHSIRNGPHVTTHFGHFASGHEAPPPAECKRLCCFPPLRLPLLPPRQKQNAAATPRKNSPEGTHHFVSYCI
eukprot:240144-Amphidinium_carterae.1